VDAIVASVESKQIRSVAARRNTNPIFRTLPSRPTQARREVGPSRTTEPELRDAHGRRKTAKNDKSREEHSRLAIPTRTAEAGTERHFPLACSPNSSSQAPDSAVRWSRQESCVQRQRAPLRLGVAPPREAPFSEPLYFLRRGIRAGRSTLSPLSTQHIRTDWPGTGPPTRALARQ
jgi:hypothetical protein